MAKSLILLSLFLFLTAFADPDLLRSRVSEGYQKEIGVREKTGKNDGPRVEAYLRSVGLKAGYAWCSAFVHYILDKAGVPNTITAWSPTAHNKKDIVYFGKKWQKEVLPGDVFTIYYTSLKRIGHTGFVHRKINDRMVETVEGNTNGGLSRSGDGVYKLVRSTNSLYSITRWIN